MGVRETFNQHIWKVLVAILGLLLVAPLVIIATEFQGLTNIATFAPPYPVTDWAQIVGAIGSVLLSGLLVVLYLLMFRTQKQQVETMQQQKEWMEIQHRPELRVTGYEIYDTIPQAREKLEVEVRNAGNGMGKDLYIRCDVRVSSENIQFEPVEDEVFELDGERFKIETHYSWLRTPEVANQFLPQRTLSQQLTGGFIGVGEQKQYEAPVWLYLVEENEDGEFTGGQGIGVQDAMLLLHETGIESVVLQVSLVYRDMGGNIGIERVLSSSALLEERYTLKQINAEHSRSGLISESDILQSVKRDNPFPSSSWVNSED